MNRQVASITKQEAYKLLEGFITDGRDYKARITLAWLRTLWRWAWKRKYVLSPIMDEVEIGFEERTRDRRFTDDEIKAVWAAADKFDPIQGAYTKLRRD